MNEVRNLALVAITGAAFAGAVVADTTITSDTQIGIGTALAVFGAAFGAWAMVLGYVMVIMRREFADLREIVKEQAIAQLQRDAKAHEDRIHIERRLTDLEAQLRRID